MAAGWRWPVGALAESPWDVPLRQCPLFTWWCPGLLALKVNSLYRLWKHVSIVCSMINWITLSNIGNYIYIYTIYSIYWCILRYSANPTGRYRSKHLIPVQRSYVAYLSALLYQCASQYCHISNIFADVPTWWVEYQRNSLYIDLSSEGEQSKHLRQDTKVQMTTSVREMESQRASEVTGHQSVNRGS